MLLKRVYLCLSASLLLIALRTFDHARLQRRWKFTAAAPTVSSAAAPRLGRIIAVLPAHNEENLILDAVKGLLNQTTPPDRIVVVADNCTDETVAALETAQLPGVAVFSTVGNRDKKAGALNQYLRVLLPKVDDDDVILVQDADSVLAETFVENAARHLARDGRLGAVGGTFRAVAPAADARLAERFLIHLQDNEYARYARDVRRLRGKCLVVTGTAAAFRAGTLKRLVIRRMQGELPRGDGAGGVYDTTVLTEDNELSFAVMSIGMKLLAPPDCLLKTDAMTSWRELWKQRLRWKRGAIENCMQYGFTRVTVGYWARQFLSLLGVIITVSYFSSIIWSFALIGGITMHPFWILLAMVFVLERFVTLKDKGPMHRGFAATMYELPYELFLQIVHARAFFDILRRTERKW